MTPAQISAELQRKKNLNLTPTDKANMGAFKKLTAQPGVTKPAAPKPPKPVIAGEGNSFVRDYLLGQGYANDQIGFNKGTGSVSLNGLDFLTPTRVEGNRSIASTSALDSAMSRRRDSDSTNKNNEVLGKLETQMTAPPQAAEFNYDPTTDPVYQAALRRATENANTAGGNAMAELNRRGILNSTITSDRLGQIQQSELGRVSDTVLPQLFGQAYERHRDAYGDQYRTYRDGIGDLNNLIGVRSGLNQNQVDNQFRNEQFDWQQGTDTRNFNRGVLEDNRNFNRGVLEDNRNFGRGVLEDNRNFGRGVLESDRGFELDRSRESRLSAPNGAPTAFDSETRVYFDNMVQRDDAGKITNTEALESAIMESPLSDHDAYQLYKRYGLPWNGPVPSPN